MDSRESGEMIPGKYQQTAGFVEVEDGVKADTYCVSVHEAPDCCSHFTRKQDHQKEEELKREKQKNLVIRKTPCFIKGPVLYKIHFLNVFYQ